MGCAAVRNKSWNPTGLTTVTERRVFLSLQHDPQHVCGISLTISEFRALGCSSLVATLWLLALPQKGKKRMLLIVKPGSGLSLPLLFCYPQPSHVAPTQLQGRLWGVEEPRDVSGELRACLTFLKVSIWWLDMQGYLVVMEEVILLWCCANDFCKSLSKIMSLHILVAEQDSQKNLPTSRRPLYDIVILILDTRASEPWFIQDNT